MSPIISGGGGGGGGSQTLIQTSTHLSNAQILSLYTTPVQIAPSPGPGKVIIPLQICHFANITTQFDLHGQDIGADWEAEITTETMRVTDQGSGLLGLGPKLVFWDSANITGGGGKLTGGIALWQNQGFFIYVTGANLDPSDGVGQMEVEFLYWVVDAPAWMT